KESQFNYSAFRRINGSELCESIIEPDQVHARLFGDDIGLTERQSKRAAAALCPVLRAGVIDQDSAHDLCGNAKEVSAILPVGLLLIYQSEVDIVNHRGRLQAVIRTLMLQITSGDSTQLRIDEWQQFVERLLIAVVASNQ